MANTVPLSGSWFPNTQQPGSALQAGGGGLQGSQGTAAVQKPVAPAIQSAPDVTNSTQTTPAGVLGANTSVDPAAATAAADAAKQAALRTDVTRLVNSIKDIFNSRYGQVDAQAGEQVGNLNTRFGNESSDIARQVGDETNNAGAAYAGKGTFDSSYRGNTVDTITKAGESQVRDLGDELKDNIAKIAAWVTQQKTGFDASKGGVDAILSHLAESTDTNELSSIRNSLESRMAELQAGGADLNTAAQNAASLSAIAPSNPRAVQLKTTLGQIIAGNADSSQKAAIGSRLIASAGLTPEEQQQLMQGFQGDLSAADQKKQAA
jgi:hypothetical protein